jgi:hypothetical protein
VLQLLVCARLADAVNNTPGPAAQSIGRLRAVCNLQAATARPYQFGASPRLGQFVFGGVPTLTSFGEPAAAQPLFSNRQAGFGGKQASVIPPASQPQAAGAGSGFAGASGVTFGTLAAAAAAASQPAACWKPAGSTGSSAPAFLLAAATATAPSVSVGPSPLSATIAPPPFGIPSGPFPLPAPTLGFGTSSSGASIGASGRSGPGSASGTAAVSAPAATAAVHVAPEPCPVATTPSPAAGSLGTQQPMASAAAATRPPIPRVPIAAVVSAAAAASAPPAVAADTPRGSNGIETPRASAAKKPKSDRLEVPLRSEAPQQSLPGQRIMSVPSQSHAGHCFEFAPDMALESLQPSPYAPWRQGILSGMDRMPAGRLLSPPWTGSAAFTAEPAGSKPPTLPTQGSTATSTSAGMASSAAASTAANSVPCTSNGNGTLVPTSTPATFGVAGGNGVSSDPPDMFQG